MEFAILITTGNADFGIWAKDGLSVVIVRRTLSFKGTVLQDPSTSISCVIWGFVIIRVFVLITIVVLAHYIRFLHLIFNLGFLLSIGRIMICFWGALILVILRETELTHWWSSWVESNLIFVLISIIWLLNNILSLMWINWTHKIASLT